MAQSDNGEGLVKLVWMSSMKVNLGDYGDVGGIWKVPWVQELVIEVMRFLATMKSHLTAKRFVGYV